MTDLANMHPADVIAGVTKAGSSLSELARIHKMHPSSFHHALRRPIPEANRAIAKFLGKRLMELWPDWFDERGGRRHLRREPSQKPGAGKSQKSALNTDRRSAA